jgi:protein SCO1/2
MVTDMKSGLKRAALILIVGGGFLAAALAVGWFQTQRQAQPVADANQSVPIGGPFTLVDENGQTVTDQTYRGKWLVVFFGFTHCPDVCPTALNDIALTLDQLGPLAERIQPLFVTIDPERDTAEIMKDYTDAFHPRIVGLTGTPEQIASVAKAYRVYYKKVPQGDGSGNSPGNGPGNVQGDDYTMDHSGITYVMTPQGKFAAHFSPHTPIDEMVAKLRGVMSGKQS